MNKFTILALISLISAPVLANEPQSPTPQDDGLELELDPQEPSEPQSPTPQDDGLELELDPQEPSEPESPTPQDDGLELELDPQEPSEPESPTPQDDNADPQSNPELFDPDSQIVPGVEAEPHQLTDGRLVMELESDLTLYPIDEDNDDSVGEPASDDPDDDTDEAQKSDLSEALITDFVYNGSGCSGDDNMQAILTPSKENLLVFFDGFGASSGEQSPRIVRKTCNMAIALQVPSGVTVGLVGYQYGGSAETPETVVNTYRTEHFFAGSRGPISTENLTSPSPADFLLQEKLSSDSAIWSPCGRSVLLRVNSTTLIRGEGASTSVYFGWLNLRWKYCSSEAGE